MNDRKSLYTIIVLLVLIIAVGISIIPFTRADSGWDGSYDGGGYSDDGGSYSDGGDSSFHDSSSHSSGSSGTREYREPTFWDFLLLSLAAVMGIFGIFLIIHTQKERSLYSKKNEKIEVLNDGNFIIDNETYSEKSIMEILPDFKEEEFLLKAYSIYRKIQTAWMNFDYDTLRKYTTDELYNLYHSQLVALNIKKQKNVMDSFSLESSKVVNMQHNKDYISLDVEMIVKCFDYVVDKNDNVIRGNKYNKVCYHYEMNFIKGLKNVKNKCPNCGSALNDQNSNVCPYCRSVIISNNHDWVLAKKRVIKQTRNTKR